MRAVLCALLAALAARAAEREPRGAPRCTHERCRYIDFKGDDLNDSHVRIYGFIYSVDGNIIAIDPAFDNYYLRMHCLVPKVLNFRALPCFETAQRVSHFEQHDCLLPFAGSLADTLATLNVTLEHSYSDALNDPNETLTISFQYNFLGSAPLAAKHLVGLEHLVNLRVYGSRNFTPVYIECRFLAKLQRLRSLTLKNVKQLTCELDVSLSLRDLSLDLDNVRQLPVVPTLEELSLSAWTEPRPAPLARCDSLRQLRLYYPKMIALPDSWLVNCFHLEVLYIEEASHLTTLPPNLLIGTKALKTLSVTRGGLEMLPEGLLDYSTDLNLLELDNNHLNMLPSDIFNVARRVQKLNLSLNELQSSAIEALAPLVELTELNLSHNPRLGDVCLKNGYSPIRNVTKLRKLNLKDTGITRICRDWREDMTVLEILDLSQTLVTELSFQDLQFTRTVEAKVILLNLTTPVAVEMTRVDYTNGARDVGGGVDMQLDNLVECDCSMYWTRRVLDLPGPASRLFDSLSCSDGRWLRDVSPEDMICAQPEECGSTKLPATCACDERPDDVLDHDSWLVRVRCEHAGLQNIPDLRSRDNSTERHYEMFLAGNNISHLHADSLMYNIKVLDLRDNALGYVDEETARKLGDMDGILLLAGNPFDCSCRAAPLLRALHAHNATQTDLMNSTCSDGSRLHLTPIEDCLPYALSPVSLGTWFAIVLGVILGIVLIVFSAALSLTSRERRFFVQAVLHRWGIVWRTAEPVDDEGCRYDAFVTFSHKDEALVPELMARLEPTYRLCVHYRDWTPGCFISEQVVDSVRESRRTIALVSRHFLASSWARAEFREAHAAAMLDARPRLIVILLEEPTALEMDDLLRRYVKTHTYLRWGEPWFWDKLAVALPRPRAPPTPEPAPEPAPPASPSPALTIEMTPVCDRAVTETDATAPVVASHSAPTATRRIENNQ